MNSLLIILLIKDIAAIFFLIFLIAEKRSYLSGKILENVLKVFEIHIGLLHSEYYSGQYLYSYSGYFLGPILVLRVLFRYSISNLIVRKSSKLRVILHK